MISDGSALQEKLRHVYWIAGGSAAGKSTIASRIATQHGLHLYSTDEVMSDHGQRITPKDCPFLTEFVAMDMDERWVKRSPKTMLETFHWFRGEGFSLIVEDLLSLARKPAVIVEGFRLLPHLVKPLLAKPCHAVWLLPTPDFRKTVFNSRGGSAWSFLGKTSDPDKALQNLLERDQMFTDHLCEETNRLELNSLRVSTTMTENDLTEKVTELFEL